MLAWRGLSTGPGDGDLEPLRPPRERSTLRVLAEIPLLVVFAAVIAVLVKSFIAQAFFIPSASMEPQLAAGDRVVVSRLAYDLHEPRRGDIVVFDDPGQPPPDADDSFIVFRIARDALEAVGVARPDERELIKRVIALPGETVAARGGVVHIDDRPLSEPYLSPVSVTADFPPYTVPDGHVFVMGDNRTNSKDSRSFDAVPADSIVGRAIARVWPPGRVAFL